MAASLGPLTPDEPPGPASPRWPCTATAVFPMAVLTLPNEPFRPVPTALPLWAPGPFGGPDRSAEGYLPRGEVKQGEKNGQGQELGQGGLQRAYMGLREGDLHPLRRYAWYALRVRHGGRKGKTLEEFGGLQGLLDGARTLGEVIAGGAPEGPVRRYPVQALASGELSPPGQGWLLRDLAWERARPLGKSCPCARLFAPKTGVRRPSPPEPPPLPSSGVGPSPPPQGESLPFRGRGNPHS